MELRPLIRDFLVDVLEQWKAQNAADQLKRDSIIPEEVMDQINGVKSAPNESDEAIRSAIDAWHGYEPGGACQPSGLPGTNDAQPPYPDGSEVVVPIDASGLDQSTVLNRVFASAPGGAEAGLDSDERVYADTLASLRAQIGKPGGNDVGPQTIGDLMALVRQSA